MKVPGLCLFVTASFALMARADLTLVQKIERTGSITEATFKIKGDKVRIEIPGGATTILDKKTGETLLLYSTKQFRRIPGNKPKTTPEMAKDEGKTAPGAQTSKLSPTGKKETINGHETDEFIYETPSGKSSFWIALKYPDAALITRQLQPISPDDGPDYRDLPGVPIRIHRKTSRGENITITVLSIKQDPLSDAEYSPPKDFQDEALSVKPSPAPSSKP